MPRPVNVALTNTINIYVNERAGPDKVQTRRKDARGPCALDAVFFRARPRRNVSGVSPGMRNFAKLVSASISRDRDN